MAVNPSDPSTITKYVDKLPLPQKLKPKNIVDGTPYYEVEMRQVQQKLHRDFPDTTVWGYQGTYPGPTIEVQKNQAIKVKWINKLPNNHILPVDKTVHGAGPPHPEVRTVVHLHGGNVLPENDGYPEAWFTRNFKKTGPFFVHKVYYYPNRQRSTTLWYHDHAVGITRLNVYAGLAGFYLIREPLESLLRLPGGPYEIPVLIQDRSFNADGSLFYPSQPDPPVPGVDPSIVPEFFGNIIVVNGKVWPYLEVEPRKYRFRFLNGSDSRFYRMRLTSGQPFIQIGTDGGFLESPVVLDEIILAPGERADVILDFTGLEGQQIILANDAPAPFPNGDPPDANTGQIMQFRVTLPLIGKDKSCIPSCLTELPVLSEESVRKVRKLTLVESRDEFDRLLLLLNGRRWADPVTENPLYGSTEIWELINTTPDTHPIHLHLVQFNLLNRQPFDLDRFMATGELVFTGPPVPPDSNERGLKDTIRANPNEVTRIIARFGLYYGLYVWHCHILEHEDHEMMRPYMVEPGRLYDDRKR